MVNLVLCSDANAAMCNDVAQRRVYVQASCEAKLLEVDVMSCNTHAYIDMCSRPDRANKPHFIVGIVFSKLEVAAVLCPARLAR